jgi:hypothetical protein
MKRDPNFYRTDECAGSCPPARGSGLRFLVLSNMGTHVDDHDAADPPDAASTAAALRRLSQPELDVCVLHLADGWPQATVARWLGFSRRNVQLLLGSAVRKAPALRRLWARTGAGCCSPPRRPRVLHLSQLASAERGPFDADDL